jgi:o-succinylbenzoate---CoA ligase
MPELVALDMAGGPQFLEALLAVWESGDTVLPVDQRLPKAAKDALFRAVKPTAVIDTTGNRTKLREGVTTQSGDAVVIATSGTTGLPKGVILTHDALLASAVASSQRLAVNPDRDTWLGCLPVAHIGGFSVVTKALLTGTPLTLRAGFDVADVEAASGSHTLVSLVTTALGRVRTERWRVILLGGSAMPDDLPPNVVRTYGLTETGSGLVYNGVCVDTAEVRCLEGHIEVRGPMLFRAYRSDSPEGTRATESDGWFATGDAGIIGGDGQLRVFGRVGDVIVTGGEKVWPDAVERALRDFAPAREVAVAGRPDAEWGHQVVAWVVADDPDQPPSLEAVREHVKQTLPSYAAPKAMVLVDQLPRTAIGKVQRSLLPDHG